MSEETAPRKKPKSARRFSRELALQGLYADRVGKSTVADIENHLAEFPDYPHADAAFLLRLLRGTLTEKSHLEATIAPHIDRPFAELSPVEAAILLLGCFELSQCKETPYRVIINEAIELSKSFGGTDGHKYVNGVLDKLALSLRPEEIQQSPEKKHQKGMKTPCTPA